MWQFLFSTVIAWLTAPLVIRQYLAHRWVDHPQLTPHTKKTHTHPVPRGGGIVVFVSVLLASLLFLEFDKYLIAILLGAGILTVVGVLDDIYDIHPVVRLIAGTIAALIVVGSGIGIAYVSNPFGPGVIHFDQPQLSLQLLGETRNIWLVADLFALIFILWNMNIVNWAKGIDGQMPGFVSISLIFIGLLSTKFADDPTQFNTMHLSFITAGAFAGLLYWNWYPQKMMPGYGAGSLAGYFISVLAILSGAKLAITFMVLAIPTADAGFTIIRRLWAKRSPIWGDRGHLHHRLLDVFSWGKRRIALFYWLASFTMGVLALYLDTIGKLVTIAVMMVVVCILLLWATYVDISKKKHNHKN